MVNSDTKCILLTTSFLIVISVEPVESDSKEFLFCDMLSITV